MLNLQFEEAMKLTEEELQVVSGGDLVYTGNIPGSGLGTSRSIANFWEKNFNHDSSTVNRRR